MALFGLGNLFGNRRQHGTAGIQTFSLGGDEAITPANVERSGAVRACVNRIVDSAIAVPFISDNTAVSAILADPSGLAYQSAQDFYRSAYENYLVAGNCFIFRRGGKLRIGIADQDAQSAGDGSPYWQLALENVTSSNYLYENIPVERVAHMRFSARPHALELAPSPAQFCLGSIAAYQGAEDLLNAYAQRANRITGTLAPDANFLSDSDVVTHMRDVVTVGIKLHAVAVIFSYRLRCALC